MCVWASDTHTDSYQQIPNRIYVKWRWLLWSQFAELLTFEAGVIALRRSKRYVDAQQCVRLHWTGLQGQVLEKTVVELLLTHSCTRSVVQVWLDYHATPKICKQKPQKSMNEHARRLWRQFWGRSSPVVGRMPPKARKGRCPVAEQSFGMCNICIHTIVFELRLDNKERKKERKKMNKTKIFTGGFSNLLRVSGSFTVDLVTE